MMKQPEISNSRTSLPEPGESVDGGGQLWAWKRAAAARVLHCSREGTEKKSPPSLFLPSHLLWMAPGAKSNLKPRTPSLGQTVLRGQLFRAQRAEKVSELTITVPKTC